MNLSILVPSNRPAELEIFKKSVIDNFSGYSKVEFIVVKDCVGDEPEFVEYHQDEPIEEVIAHVLPKPNDIGRLLTIAYKLAKYDWIFLANDDVICETKDWDQKLAKALINYAPDELSLFWFNDNMLCERLSCFPVVSKKALEMIKLFPSPYKRFKIDDTLFHVFPPERRVYLQHIVFKHLNDKGERGFDLGDGRIYPVDPEIAVVDETEWNTQTYNRINAINRLRYAIQGPRKLQTKVLIGVPTAEMARNAVFYDHFHLMTKPEGTVVSYAHGQSPAKNRNLIIQQALDIDCSHVLFIDDDTLFPQDMLERLLAHNEDIVSGLYLMRNHPHKPIIFDLADENGRARTYFPKDGEQGLIEIVAAGLGCILINTDVFRKMEAPWIRLGELESDQWCDDIGFFKRVREAGFKMYCDLSLRIGHVAQAAIYPHYGEDGKWYTVYNTNGLGQIAFPAIRP